MEISGLLSNLIWSSDQKWFKKEKSYSIATITSLRSSNLKEPAQIVPAFIKRCVSSSMKTISGEDGDLSTLF
jgi:hypothetical protein